MLGSSVGIEREQIFLEEIAKYPYRYSDKLVEIVKKIQQQIKNDGNSDKLRVELNRCVMDMYGLSDNYFIDYALSIQIPILCGVYKEIKCNKKLIEEYAKVFSKIWNRHFENSGVYYTINIYPDIKGKFAALEIKLSLKEKKSDIIVNDINDDIDLLTKFMIYQKNDYFYQKKDIIEGIPGWDNFIDFAGFDGIYVTSVKTDKNQDCIGKNLTEIAELRGKEKFDAVFDLLMEEENAVRMYDYYGKDEHIVTFMRRPESNICTDGLLGGKPHPRVYGSFPRVLGKFVREMQTMSLEEAIYKMTHKPAVTFKIDNRGFL